MAHPIGRTHRERGFYRDRSRRGRRSQISLAFRQTNGDTWKEKSRRSYQSLRRRISGEA